MLSLLHDLGGTGTIVLFVLFSFACAFCVLTHDASAPRDETLFARLGNVMTLLLGVTLNGEPLTISEYFVWSRADASPFDSDSATQLESSAPDWVGFAMMAIFGFAVVILMLNMVIASFSRIVDRQDENIDANYKLKFAQALFALPLVHTPSDVFPACWPFLRRTLGKPAKT